MKELYLLCFCPYPRIEQAGHPQFPYHAPTHVSFPGIATVLVIGGDQGECVEICAQPAVAGGFLQWRGNIVFHTFRHFKCIQPSSVEFMEYAAMVRTVEIYGHIYYRYTVDLPVYPVKMSRSS